MPKFLPPHLQAFDRLFLFLLFSSFREYEIKFHTKGFGRKSTKIFDYENFFFYSSKIIRSYVFILFPNCSPGNDERYLVV